MISTNTGKRGARRTKVQLEKDIMDALEQLIIERGFMNIPMLTLVKAAGIDPNVFYRHYGTIENLLDKFTSQYDFWLNDIVNISNLPKLGNKKFYTETLKGLYNELAKSPVMQKLLAWELAEDNPTTRRTAGIREKLNLNLIAYYEELFQSAGIDIKSITALLTGGIYYLALYQNRSKLCTIDFSTEEGQKRLANAIELLVNMLFDKLEQKQKQQQIIQKMQNDGILQAKILEYLDITPYQYKKIMAK